MADASLQRLRRLTLQIARRTLKFLAVLARKIWGMRDDREFVLYRGYLLPPRDLRGRMCGDAFRSDDFFLQSAVVEATRLPATLGYSRTNRLVDVGCGLGRLATGLLAEFGDVAYSYLGVDANREFVGWCQEHIERRHPSFRFMHIDVANKRYNPNGTVDGNKIRLPVANASADIVYMWGVFTNMAPEHVQIYVSELSRIARDGGKVFLTAFVEDNVPEVSFNPTDYVPYDCSAPLVVVRYNKQWLFSLFSRHGLRIDDFRYHGGMFPKQSEICLTKIQSPPAPEHARDKESAVQPHEVVVAETLLGKSQPSSNI
jgi:SAM-dependent methyltransferase